MSFYDNVKKLCDEKGISISNFATELGFSRAAPTKWKTMQDQPRASTVKKVADYFNVPISRLIDKEYVEENNSYDYDPQTREMLLLYQRLSVVDKAKVLIFTNDLIKNTEAQ